MFKYKNFFKVVLLFCFAIAIAGCSSSSSTDSGGGGTGTFSGLVNDAFTDTAISGAQITLYSGSTVVVSATSNASGLYSADASAGTGYSVVISKAGYITESYENVTIVADDTTYLETVLQISTTYLGIGDIEGNIYNALDGTGISGLDIDFRRGINVRAGTIDASTTTGTDGYYTVASLDAGNYTGEISGTGYSTAYFTVVCLGGYIVSGQDGTITPTLPAGETRIVLTWGEFPYDIDSHLTGPIAGSSSRFHVYYSDQGSQYYSPYALLDYDDTWSYGPETTTIYQQTSGVYRFSVHDYSNAYDNPSTALSNSSAQVKVYSSAGLVATYNVPPNQGGTLWTVFELNGDTITTINTMTYQADEYYIQAPGSGDVSSHSDAGLMKNLPLK